MAAQRTSKKGRRFIEREEGVILHAYNDPVGHCTAFVGHLIHHGPCTNADYKKYGRKVPTNPVARRLRLARARQVLAADLRSFEQSVRNVAGRALVQRKFDALVSLAFNIGRGAFESSTVARRVRQRHGNVGEAMLRWKWAGGQPILLGRRQREVNLYRHGRYS